ncbi:hypothetical protein [Bradyrhizobium diversitatis]|uniref:Formate dehydrogenase accessory protein FdhE n=1 Tax=Bradyrhizobium diversitatis TaxID=2755406 RepID=A0ABS0NVM0_9BRAD|nr:hypothetical protein [Bradyrhizobium diversitatis]MBH5385046.1 hypothetical protein [Bradyrhizobium diversitatis]
MSDYWHLTRKHLEKSAALLASGDDDDLVYACLELRKSLEAYAYSLLQKYLSEVPLRAVETWQPDKVLKELLAIDPNSEASYKLRVKRNATETEEEGAWKVLGEDRRLPIGYLRNSYHALGSFLHVPTIRQSTRSADFAPARARALEIHNRISAILAPGRIIGNLGNFYHFNCCECETPVARRREFILSGGTVECGNCGQTYDVESEESGQIRFIPRSFSWDCPRCGAFQDIVQSRAKEGIDVTCKACSLPTTLHFEQVGCIQYDATLLDESGEGEPKTR